MKAKLKLVIQIFGKALLVPFWGYLWCIRQVNESLYFNSIDHIYSRSVIYKSAHGFKFALRNHKAFSRIMSLKAKEPETISWLDEWADDKTIFWDVGANLGLFSLYFSSICKGNAVLFEPLPSNVSAIIENFNLNDLTPTIVTTPLSDKDELVTLGAKDAAGASNLAMKKQSSSRTIENRCDFVLPAITAASLVEAGLPLPSMIKIDTDGSEGLILIGLKNILESGSVKTVLIETDQATLPFLSEILEGCNYTLRNKYQKKQNHEYNTIWVLS